MAESNFPAASGSLPSSSNPVAPTKTFPFLKRGQGISARFGNIAYRKPNSRSNNQNTIRNQNQYKYTEDVQMPSTSKATGNARTVTPTATDSGCEEPLVHSVFDSPRHAAGTGRHDTSADRSSYVTGGDNSTANFEQLERAVNESGSTDGDISRLYNRFMNNIQPNRARTTSNAPAARPPSTIDVSDLDQDPPSRHLAEVVQSPSSCSRTNTSSNDTENTEQLMQQFLQAVDHRPPQPPPQPQTVSAVPRLGIPRVLSPIINNRTILPPTHQQNFPPAHQQNLPPATTIMPQTGGNGTGTGTTTQSQSQASSDYTAREQQLIGHLQALVKRSHQMQAAFDAQEINYRQRQEKLKTDYEQRLQADKEQLRIDRELFEQQRDTELADIRRSRDALNKQRALVERKDTETVKILKEQVSDLQDKVCERDAIVSKNRTQLTTVKTENTKLQQRVNELETKLKRSDAEGVSLQKANAALRVKLTKQVYSQASNAQNTPPNTNTRSNKSTDNDTNTANNRQKQNVLTTNNNQINNNNNNNNKQVRFAPTVVNESSNTTESSADMSSVVLAPFQRTDNRATQTSFLQPNAESQQQNGRQMFTQLTGLNTPQTISIQRSSQLPDGSKELIYTNGTSHFQGRDGLHRYDYANGDSRVVEPDGKQMYYYASDHMTLTIYPKTGLQTVRFEDGHEERHHVDGRKEIHRDGRVTLIDRDGTSTTEYPDGVKETVHTDGTRVLHFTNGDVETQTPDVTKRVFATGDVKYLYPNGCTMTEYANGRVRIKDANGVYVHDEYLKQTNTLGEQMMPTAE